MTVRQRIMKLLYPLAKLMSAGSGKFARSYTAEALANSSIWDLDFQSIAGSKVSMVDFRGKNILIVNTASDCGYTGQYKELQDLQVKRSNVLVVIGFPSNDFKEQEKLSNDEIAIFCEKNYGVSFSLAAKSVVKKAEDQHPIFKWLSDSNQNGWNDMAPTWNFTKYLIDSEGNLKGMYEAGVLPEIINMRIE